MVFETVRFWSRWKPAQRREDGSPETHLRGLEFTWTDSHGCGRGGICNGDSRWETCLWSTENSSDIITEGPTTKVEDGKGLGEMGPRKHARCHELMRTSQPPSPREAQMETLVRFTCRPGGHMTRGFTWPGVSGGQFGHVYLKYWSAYPITQQTCFWSSVL